MSYFKTRILEIFKRKLGKILEVLGTNIKLSIWYNVPLWKLMCIHLKMHLRNEENFSDLLNSTSKVI